MSEIKVGDQVAIGPFVVAREPRVFGFAAVIREGSDDAMWMDGFHPDDAMPWHPALPALARWLREHPEANVLEVVVMLRSDAAALVEAIEADITVDCIACDCGPESPTMKEAYERLGRARKAITQDLLARVKGAR